LADSTTAMKQVWNDQQKNFVNDTRTQTVVKLIKTCHVEVEGQQENCILYELTLIADARIAFGGQNLVVPNAIAMRSMMLVGETKGLLCEWSIKTSPVTNAQPGMGPDDIQSQKTISYVELIQYKALNK
jgi:hypothetical protein